MCKYAFIVIWVLIFNYFILIFYGVHVYLRVWVGAVWDSIHSFYYVRQWDQSSGLVIFSFDFGFLSQGFFV